MIPRSKNKELIQNIEEKRERYSIRKFSAGAASVLIGISFMGMANSQVVKADTKPASNDENHEATVRSESTDGVTTSDENAKVVVAVNNSGSQNSDKNKAANNAQSENDSAQTTAETKTDEAKTNTQTEQNDSTQTFDVRNAGSQGMSAQAVNDQKTADQTLKQNAEKTATTENQSKTDQKEYDTEPTTNKSVTRTVTLNAPKGGSYTDKNGNKTNTTTQTDTINYTRRAQQDLATKKWTITSNWTADQNHPDGKFAKQEIQTFPGYKPSSSNLNIEEDEGKFYIPETDVEKDADGNLKDSQYSIDFEALQETAKLNFIANDDKKTIVSSQEISGKTGDEVALSLDGANGLTKLDVPTNWKIVPNTPYPTSITIRPNASADIYVEHATTTTSEQVQVTRTITKKIQDKTIGTATQTLSFTRNQVTDPVTGQPTYTDWKSNTIDNNNNPISQYPEIDVSYTGYIPTTDKGSIINKDGKYYLAAANAETDSTGKPINTNVIVSYTADQNVKFTQVVNYMNGTTNVGTYSISGNAGETVNDVTKQIEDHVPTNYEIVPNTKVISTITFGNENPDPVNVQVQPKQTPVDPNKDPQNQIRQVTRKITIQMPGQAAQDMGTQGVTYYRNGTKDDVTGKITYGEWKVATNSETNKPFDQVWAAYNLTQPGYTPTAIDRDSNNTAVALTNENGNVELPQVNVTPDTKSQDILVTYTANSHKYVINYIDDTTKQTVGSQTVEGKTGEKVSYTLQYPNGYKLANVTQTIPGGTISFGSNDPAASTVLVEKESSTHPDNPDQTYTYTINYANNGQTVGSQNVTGKTGQQVQITLNVPNGYKLASGAQYPTSYTFGNQNASTTVQVEKDSTTPVDPNQEVKQVINYVYNGQTVGSQTLTGKIGTTKDIDWKKTGKGVEPKIPEHYTLVAQKLYGQFTFHENAEPIVAQVEPKTTIIDGSKETNNRDFYRDITQTINYNYPNQKTDSVVSHRIFVRNGNLNEVTGEISYTKWVTAGGDFIARPVQNIPGYTVQVTNGDGQVVQLVDGQIPAEAVNENSANTVYNVNYTAQTLSFKINYINQANNQVVQSYTISGKPDQTVTINAPIPENWQVVAGQTVPKEGDYKFGNVAPSDMNVLIEPQTISGNQQGNQDNPDLYRTVNEVVNITGPNGDTQTRTQNLAFYRSKTFDPSTSNWKYGEWQSNMSNKATTFSPVSFTNLDGYTFKVETSDDRTVTPVINGNTASIEDVSGLVNGSPTNITINVAYINKYTGKPDNPESTYTYTINYMSNGQNVGMQNVTGKAGQTVQITLNVPKGYKLANGAQVLTSYTFGTQNASTNVQVVEDNGQTPNPDQTYTYTINYLDNGQNVGTQNVTGKSGQTVQITLNLPDGYQLANGTSYPTTYTFGNQNSSTNVNVTKKSTNPDQTYSMQIQYINAQDNKQVGSFTVSGKSGQTIQLTQEIQGKVPENYEIVPNSKYPTSVTFGNSDQAPALVYVQAEQINVTDDPSLKDQTEKTISRQIVYKFPGQADQTTDQSITFKRLAYKNAVTDQITYGDWSNDGKYTFSPIQIKQQDGYTASASEIPAWTVTAEGQNDTAPVVITFTSTTPDNPDNPDQTYTYTINYVDNGQNVGTQNVTGKSGQTVQITLNVPNGYKVDGQYPTSYTFGKQNASTTVNVVKDTTPDNPGQTISGLDHKDDPSLYREVTQTITVTYPNEQPQSTTNSLIFYRTKTTKDGQTTYSKWTSNSGTADQLVYDFKEQKVTQLPGYTVNVQKDGKGLELVTKDGASYIPSQAALNANGEPENQTITITYASENLSVKINYVANNDHSKVIATQTISGKTGEHVPVNLEVPKNWQVVPNTSVPTSITITPDAKDRTVYIEHKLVTVDGRNDQSNGNLYQKVTRTIVMNYPNQKAGEATSTLEFYRIQTTDEVTGKVTYTDWTSNSVNADKQVINEYPEQNVSLDGYTATSSDVQLITKDGKQYVPATQVARNNENVPISNTIVVNYVGNEQTVEINYVNGNNLIKTQKFSGRTGQTVAVPLELPNGYEIAANVNYPTQITFGANTEKTLTIQVTPIPSGQQKQTINYVDPSGQVVGSQYVVGTIGQTVDVKASLPINWKLADGASVPSQVTIQNTDTPISVKVVSETVTINPSKPVTPGTPINSTGQTYPAGLTANDLNKTVTRTVDIVSPDGKTTTTVQKVEFSRDATLSIATGQITYGDWKAKGNKVFNAISVPVIDGYKASGKVDEVEPSADYGNQTLTITYTKVTGQQTDSDKYTPNVVNNGSVSVDVNGDLKPEDVISNKDSLPKGTTIEWSNPDQVAQDLKKAGTYKDVGVKITYPDKSTTITKVTITVQDKQSSTYTQQIIFVNQKDNKEIKSYTFEGKLTDGHAVLSVDKLKQAIEILFGDITSDAQYKNAKIVESSLPTKDIDITGPTTKPITILVNVEGTSDNRNNSGNNSNTGDNTNPINPDNPNPVNPDNNNSGNNNNNSNNSNTNNGNANNSNNNQSSNNTNNSTNENKPNNGNNSSNIDDNSGDNGDDYDDNDSDDSNEITPKRHKSHTSSNSHAATGNTGMTVAHANNARWLASHGYVVAVGPHGEVLNYYKASNGKGRIVTIAPHGENELANSSSSSVRSAGLAGVKNANETNGNSRKGKLPQTGEKDESALIGLGLIAGAGLLGLAGDRKRKRD
ncbi:YSIRK-type signal peptide-containing protein [Lactobacillus intestinalis]|uniref:YSIRK-type signal peptide-containing protein n=1 Tax=Lactobacillus intestinalis TaxID=151781 RepID=A0A4S2BA79_9LACO|nr:Rib/alpha-like domain-containing protein [Lactobacillus intestinalis]TGY11237.1 YSIRK-type signal peptide-containing protein [Lactobacillus intestinalis]